MNKKEIAAMIGKDLSTLYNWEKNNPELYKAVWNYYNKEDENLEIKEIYKLFKELSEEEKNYVKSEIQMLALRKKIKW